MVKFIKKRDGKIDRFDPARIRTAISKAVRAVYIDDEEEITEAIFLSVTETINQNYSDKNYLSIEEIEKMIIECGIKSGYTGVGRAYQNYRDKRAEVRKILAVATNIGEKNSTDSALLIESDSKEVLGTWDRERIVQQLESEA